MAIIEGEERVVVKRSKGEGTEGSKRKGS